MGSRKKIVLVGPVYPYKGGISHYTSLMCKALRKGNDVYMMSYKLQYPRLLYKKEQKDFGNDAFRIEGTDFAVNTASPFSWVSAALKIRRMEPDLVVFQWWHPYFAPCYATLCSLLGKAKILFVCHNVFPHERFAADRLLARMALRKGGYFIVHSEQDASDLKSIKADARYRKTVLPTYNAFRLKNMSKQEARDLLNLPGEERVLLFFGFVREYKGLKHLLKAMPKVMEGLENVRLLVVGDFPGNKVEYQELIDGLGIGSAVDVYDGYIPDQEVEKFFAASDLVVLPYESATQSGIVQIAYGFEKPVVVTNVGGLPEVVINDKTGYIVEPFDSAQLADSIVRFFIQQKAKEFQKEIKVQAFNFSWEKMAETVDVLCETV